LHLLPVFPEDTLLYQVVEEYWHQFLERANEAGGLPRFVVREFEEYLRCGILEHGLARLACRHCGHEIVVAWSCKGRAWCPSCCGRRMADVAAHLVESVLPVVPHRQWVCSLPFAVRTAVGFDRRLCADVLEAFIESLMRLLRRKAKRTGGLGSVDDAKVGAITFIQRFDSAARLDPHFHCLVPDGAWIVDEAGEPRFFALGDPSPEDLRQVAAWTHARLVRVLERHGRLEAAEALAADHPALASCYGASAGDLQLLGEEPGQRTQKAFGPVAVQVASTAQVAEVGGVNVYVGPAVDGRDRRRLEQLCRYMARPPLSQDRLSRCEDGRIKISLKKAWKNGTQAILLHPLDFLARLCALIPPPRFCLLRYHGLFAGGSALRRAVVPGRPEARKTVQIPLFEREADPPPAAPPSRHPWPWLLRRVWLVEILKCPVRGCTGEMRVVEVARTQEHAGLTLAGLGLGPRSPTRRTRIPARQLALPLKAT